MGVRSALFAHLRFIEIHVMALRVQITNSMSVIRVSCWQQHKAIIGLIFTEANLRLRTWLETILWYYQLPVLDGYTTVKKRYFAALQPEENYLPLSVQGKGEGSTG